MAKTKTQKTEVKMHVKESSVVGTRGRTFEGTVVKKFDKRAVVEFDRTVKVAKYERFMRKTTRVHSRIPANMQINIGDYVKVQECRPLSKMIHSIVIEYFAMPGIFRKYTVDYEGENKNISTEELFEEGEWTQEDITPEALLFLLNANK